MSKATNISVERVVPLHGVRDRAKLSALTVAMRGGWDGRPLLGELLLDGYTVRLWTGSHRFAAALHAGLEDVPVVLIDTDALDAAGLERGSDTSFREAMDEDDDAILAALAAADADAAALLAKDIR